MLDGEYTITRYERRVPGGLEVSPYVRYLLVPQAPWIVWWLAARSPSKTTVGGLRLNLRGGPTGRDVLGDSVAVEDLSVDPSYQRAGVGTTLMRAVETWVSSRPDLAQTIGLGVETDNTNAIAFYRPLGYVVAEQDGVPITFAGTNTHPCQVMFKRLDPSTT